MKRIATTNAPAALGPYAQAVDTGDTVYQRASSAWTRHLAHWPRACRPDAPGAQESTGCAGQEAV